MRKGGIKWLPSAGASGILRSREVHFMPKKHRISTKRAVIYGILGFSAVLLILYVIYCQIPRPMIPDKESRFEPRITSVEVYTGAYVVTTHKEVLDQLDADALMELMRTVHYKHELLPTGTGVTRTKVGMICIELVWVPDTIGSGWTFWELILTPDRQVANPYNARLNLLPGGAEWLHPIEDGEALYEQVYELIYG